MATITYPDLEKIWTWNTDLPETATSTVQDLITKTARARPYEPAICAWDGEFTYEQLVSFSQQAGEHIVKRGVVPGSVLLICMNKSKWMPVALLGALMADCGIALIDSSTPTERLSSIISMLNPPFVITTTGSNICLSSNVPLFAIDGLEFNKREFSIWMYPEKQYTSAIAAVVFTSGSTGLPKGVILSPECVSTTAVYGSRHFQLSRASRTFQFASFSFDISLHESLMTLVAGGCLCIPSEEQKLNDLLSAIRGFEANWICVTPSVASTTLSDMTDSCLMTVVLTGEAITARVCNLLRVDKLFGWYGASEVPLVSVTAINPKTWKSFQIGSRLPGLCWIVEPDNPESLVAIGDVGELLVEGPMQTSGYLGNNESTKAAFVTNPAWLAQGSSSVTGRSGRLYKTGDLVRYNADGSLDYIGRKDCMVKIRGQRVELGEVENQIGGLLRTNDFGCAGENARVIAETITQGINNDRVLIAFIHGDTNSLDRSSQHDTIRGQRKPGKDMMPLPIAIVPADQEFKRMTSAIDRNLRLAIPIYMLPSMYFRITSIPLTQTGKTDRKLLRSIAQQLPTEAIMAARISTTEDHIEPCNEAQRDVREIWARVLGIDKHLISANKSFLECGGDSLTAMTIAKTFQKEFGIPVKISQVISKETNIQSLAKLIGDFKVGKLDSAKQCNVVTELEHWSSVLKQSPTISYSGSILSHGVKPSVLLTGATGYLGTQILRQLVSSAQVGKIIVIVRASDVEHATKRLQTVASIAGWWTPSVKERLDVWVGDLAKPKLGLNEENWESISLVDTIIHNGAVVSWGADYQALVSVNIRSTLQLLQTSLQSHHLRRLIYVSGGMKQEHGQSDLEYINSLNDADGYDQTKYISEQLTVAAGQLYHLRAGPNTPTEEQNSPSHLDRAFTVVKPGYIIGDCHSGLSNVDDFLWKLVAGTIHMGAYPQDPPDFWLDLVEVSYVASHIIDQCQFVNPTKVATAVTPPTDDSDCENDSKNNISSSLDGIMSTLPSPPSNSSPTISQYDINRGLPVRRFWAIIRAETGIELEAMDWDKWLERANKDMEFEREKHPLWGIQEFLVPKLGGPPAKPALSNNDDTTLQVIEDTKTEEEVEAALRSCVQYLMDIKFIPCPRPASETVQRVTSSLIRKYDQTQDESGSAQSAAHRLRNSWTNLEATHTVDRALKRSRFTYN